MKRHWESSKVKCGIQRHLGSVLPTCGATEIQSTLLKKNVGFDYICNVE